MISKNKKWLDDGLARGVRERWCMRRGCTTCGCYQMIELLTGTPVSDGASIMKILDNMTWARAEEVTDGLRYCGVQTNANGVMWMLFMLWRRWGDCVHEDLFPVLDGTYAGEVLESMRIHYANRQERRCLNLVGQGANKRDWLE